MNRAGHVIYSELILILGMGTYLLFLLDHHGLYDVSVAIILSIAAYLLGCVVPDFDHHKVQDKTFLLRWMQKITKHRGTWHSLLGMFIYGIIIALPVSLLQLTHFWVFPPLAGMFGYFSHLLLDEIKNIKTKGTRAIKLW